MRETVKRLELNVFKMFTAFSQPQGAGLVYHCETGGVLLISTRDKFYSIGRYPS